MILFYFTFVCHCCRIVSWKVSEACSTGLQRHPWTLDSPYESAPSATTSCAALQVPQPRAAKRPKWLSLRRQGKERTALAKPCRHRKCQRTAGPVLEFLSSTGLSPCPWSGCCRANSAWRLQTRGLIQSQTPSLVSDTPVKWFDDYNGVNLLVVSWMQCVRRLDVSLANEGSAYLDTKSNLCWKAWFSFWLSLNVCPFNSFKSVL